MFGKFEMHQTSAQTASNIAIVDAFDLRSLVHLAGFTKHVWRAHAYYDADLTHLLGACLMACLIAFSHVVKHGESLVTERFTFDRSFKDGVAPGHVVVRLNFRASSFQSRCYQPTPELAFGLLINLHRACLKAIRLPFLSFFSNAVSLCEFVIRGFKL